MIGATSGSLLAAALFASTLTACGGDESSNDDGTTMSDGERSEVDVDGIDEVCALLTVEEVEAATGYAVEATVESPNQFSPSCDYELTGANLTVSVEIAEGAFAHSAYTEREDAELIPDFERSAAYVPTFRYLSVDLGDDVAFQIGVEGGFAGLEDPRDPLVELGLLAVDRL